MHLRKSSILSKGKYPEKVRDRFARLRGELPYHITIRKIKGTFYVVRQEYVDLDGKGGKRMLQQYLGKITEEGMFIVRSGNPKTELEVAKAIIQSHGGKITLPKEDQGPVYEQNAIQLTAKEEDVLTNLTMNARMPFDMLSKNAGIRAENISTVASRLERRLKLSYVPDIRLTKLGFIEFFVFVKFLGERPNTAEVKADLEKIGNIQLAAQLTGNYDMMLFVIAESNENLAELMKTIKMSSSLSSLPSRWEVSYFYKTKSFIPLRNEFFDLVEENNVWCRSKENPRPLPSQLLKGEFAVLKSLNRDGSAKFAEIERENSLATNSARHIYDRLIRKGILPRVTISVEGLGVKYDAIIIMQIIEEKAFQDSRKNLLEFIMEEEKGAVINRFSLVGDMSSPGGIMFFIPVVKGNELERTVSELQAMVKGTSIDTLVIDNIILGKILYRRIDPLYGGQYAFLVSDYNVKFEDRRIYDEETFYRIEKISSKYEKPDRRRSE